MIFSLSPTGSAEKLLMQCWPGFATTHRSLARQMVRLDRVLVVRWPLTVCFVVEGGVGYEVGDALRPRLPLRRFATGEVSPSGRPSEHLWASDHADAGGAGQGAGHDHQRPGGSSVSEVEIRAPAVRLCRVSSLMCVGEILCASDQRLMPGP